MTTFIVQKFSTLSKKLTYLACFDYDIHFGINVNNKASNEQICYFPTSSN